MPETWKAFWEKKLQKLTLWEHERMMVVYGRAMERLRHFFWVSFLPALMSHTRVAELITWIIKGEIQPWSLPPGSLE